MTEPQSKRCGRCKEIKSLDDFNYSKKDKYGRQSWCRVCQHIGQKQWRKEYYQKVKHSEHYKKVSYKAARKYYYDNPEKNKARVLARKYKDELLRPNCEKCGVDNKELFMHHPDYSKPLDVVTLCQPCHIKEHNYFRKETYGNSKVEAKAQG